MRFLRGVHCERNPFLGSMASGSGKGRSHQCGVQHFASSSFYLRFAQGEEMNIPVLASILAEGVLNKCCTLSDRKRKGSLTSNQPGQCPLSYKLTSGSPLPPLPHPKSPKSWLRRPADSSPAEVLSTWSPESASRAVSHPTSGRTWPLWFQVARRCGGSRSDVVRGGWFIQVRCRGGRVFVKDSDPSDG